MANTKLTDLDFEQIKAVLKDYLKNNTDFSDYDFDGSALSNIVDLLAYNTSYQAFMSNMVANESFLSSAVLRDNIILHARNLGYLPRSTKSSKAAFTFNIFSTFDGLTGSAPASITIRSGAVFTAIKDNNSYTFSTPTDITTPLVYVDPQSPSLGATAAFTGVSLYEGTYLTSTFNVNRQDLDQRFVLENSGIDLDTLVVYVSPSASSTEQITYTRSTNITQLDSESKVYFIQEIEDERYELIFGDGVIGQQLDDGSQVTVTYIISSGSDANGIQGNENFVFSGNVTNNIGAVPALQTITIANSPVTEGGAEIESIDSIKFQAPRFYSTQNRAVTASDYETITRLVYPNVDDLFAFGGEESSPPEYGRVKIVIKPKSGDKLSASSKNFIKQKLQKYKVASLSVDIIDPAVVYPVIDSVIYYNADETTSTASEIKSLVETAIDLHEASTALSKFGGKLKYSKLVSVIDDADISISRNDTKVFIRRDLQAVLNTNASYELCYVNAFQIDTDAPILSSTGFNIQGYDNTLFLEDDYSGSYVNSNRTTKNVLAYYLNNSIKTYLGEPIGTINYETGEILLGQKSSLVITGTSEPGSVVKVTVKPRSYDIFARREVFLSLVKRSIQVLAES